MLSGTSIGRAVNVMWVPGIFLWIKERPARKADNFICEPIA
jgi:hypothetical protein